MTFLPKDKQEQMRQGLVFTLTDEKKREDYSIYDATTKSFIRSGNVIDVNGNPTDFELVRFMKGEDFKTKFPNKSRTRKIVRTIMVDGNLYDYAMPISVDTQVEQILATARAMGQSPLALQFKIHKSGAGLETRYTVAPVMNNVPPTQQANQPVAISLNTQQGETTPANTIVLTDIERQLVEAIKNASQGQKLTFEQVRDNFLKYNVEESRAKQIYTQEGL